ncbi:MAG: hypothetical protein M3235_11705 [Actinomycetota bacterium]|nr:hypothetical protein [Actinomycetota bacterium]
MTELPDSVRRRLAEVFGDDLRTTRDERSDGGSASEREDAEDRERGLREDRPPHHG